MVRSGRVISWIVALSNTGESIPAAAHKHRGLLPFLGMASGISVAAIYYNQPLLLEISRTFHVSSSEAGRVAVATQVGYAIGILLFVPMGDVAERRGLIAKLFAAVTVALLAAGLAPSLWMLLAASVAVGITSAVTHVVVPIAPELVEPHESGKAIGMVMTGLLLGVLLGRAASGWVATLTGWRGVFLLAAAMTAVFIPLIRWYLPPMPPMRAVSYRAALASLWTIACEQPILRESALIGFLVFGAFSSFWTNLAFLLGSPHYRLGAGVAGSFGVLGAAGAVAASVAGRISDRRGARFVLAAALCCLGLGFAILWIFGYHIAGLVVGVLAIDIGQQGMHIGNQTRIFKLVEGARSRINAVYMIVFFFGGAMGSALSTIAWAHWQWSGVCAFALLLLAMAGVRHAIGGMRHQDPSLPATASQ
jgi:predicted MFS family arabinose efflux permease